MPSAHHRRHRRLEPLFDLCHYRPRPRLVAVMLSLFAHHHHPVAILAHPRCCYYRHRRREPLLLLRWRYCYHRHRHPSPLVAVAESDPFDCHWLVLGKIWDASCIG